jgi:collagen triple helix repeat protein
VAGLALFVALDGSAVAAGGLMKARHLATGAVTSAKIKDGSVMSKDLNASTMRALRGVRGAAGTNGAAGPAGTNGSPGAAGTNGGGGTNGADGADGTDGTDGTDGSPGTNGTDGTIAPLSASAGAIDLPTAALPTTVVELMVPAGKYVVLAKTQLDHTGAGDSVKCTLAAGATTLDSAEMRTLPALASVPVSLQSVTTATTTPTRLSVACKVTTANGHANYSQLVAIPTA